jgi:thiol-disulfide isomerase/thioredoxin
MKSKLFLAVCVLLFGAIACNPKPKSAIQTVLKGEVIDRPNSNFLVLIKEFEDFPMSIDTEDLEDVGAIAIPIHNGKFEYVLNSDHVEKYWLFFDDEYYEGSMTPIFFFSEKGTVNFILYPKDEGDKNKIEGGPLTTEYHTLRKRANDIHKPWFDAREQLENEGKYYSKKAMEIFEKWKTATDEEQSKLDKEYDKLKKAEKLLTPEGQAVEEEIKNAFQTTNDMEWQYAKEHPNIVGYSILMGVAREAANPVRHRVTPDIAPVEDLYNSIYAPKYPNHPYTEKIKKLIETAKFLAANIKVGGRYLDFELPDLDGNRFRLSEQIGGKIAVIHLWGSWCGPCRRRGLELIPIYEAFKDKGFTVVGVAREKTIEPFKVALEKDNYPWLNLVMEWDSPIWGKYGNSVGEFLVDGNGVILAINPTASEVAKLLAERLN